MKQIEIKYDYSTLPKDGQKIKYHSIDNDEWYEGVYIASDHLFQHSSNVWDFVGSVDLWEPLD